MGTRIGVLIKRQERYRTDPEFREKRFEINRKYREKNKKKINKSFKKWSDKLSEFKNKKCLVCNKLLDYRTKGQLCSKHKGIKVKI